MWVAVSKSSKWRVTTPPLPPSPRESDVFVEEEEENKLNTIKLNTIKLKTKLHKLVNHMILCDCHNILKLRILSPRCSRHGSSLGVPRVNKSLLVNQCWAELLAQLHLYFTVYVHLRLISWIVCFSTKPNWFRTQINPLVRNDTYCDFFKAFWYRLRFKVLFVHIESY